jgi:hypothetical protein
MCEDVREHLAEHLLGTLERLPDADVRHHLRGCAACRAELAALDDGLSTFSRAAHDVEPPAALERRVLAVLEEEWSAKPARHRLRLPIRQLAWAAMVLLLAASLSWGVASKMTAERYEAQAQDWRRFLTALGGDDVRVGTFRAVGAQPLEGNVVVYDSHEGRSWVLVLVRAPGRRGRASVVLSDGARSIRLPELEFDQGGEAHTWLVTGSNLTLFDSVVLTDRKRVVLATATVSGD